MSPFPVVVHCSAGIGRTGVLILMDAAMSLIEAKVTTTTINFCFDNYSMRFSKRWIEINGQDVFRGLVDLLK